MNDVNNQVGYLIPPPPTPSYGGMAASGDELFPRIQSVVFPELSIALHAGVRPNSSSSTTSRDRAATTTPATTAPAPVPPSSPPPPTPPTTTRKKLPPVFAVDASWVHDSFFCPVCHSVAVDAVQVTDSIFLHCKTCANVANKSTTPICSALVRIMNETLVFCPWG